MSSHEGTHKGCPYRSGLGKREMTPGWAIQGTHKGCPYGPGFKGFELRFL